MFDSVFPQNTEGNNQLRTLLGCVKCANKSLSDWQRITKGQIKTVTDYRLAFSIDEVMRSLNGSMSISELIGYLIDLQDLGMITISDNLYEKIRITALPFDIINAQLQPSCCNLLEVSY